MLNSNEVESIVDEIIQVLSAQSFSSVQMSHITALIRKHSGKPQGRCGRKIAAQIQAALQSGG